MGGNQFDQIAQELLKQKQRMDKLQAENRDLRRQIADLRSGRGIFVDIHGSRFALRDNTSLTQANSAPAASSTTSTVANSTPSTLQPLHEQIADAPTAAITGITPQANNVTDKKPAGRESTFLEEIMIDEFNSALASPGATWQDPTEKKQSQPQPKSQEQINEEKKAALRRELMGSFLLE